MKPKNLFDKVLEFTDRNSPAILTGLTVAGITALTVMTLQPKVKRIMAEHREAVNDLSEKEDKKEVVSGTVKKLAKECVPTVLLAGATAACAIGANSVSTRRVAALSAAYEIASRSLSDLRDSIEEVVPRKAQEIKEKVVQKNIASEPIPDESQIYSTGRGDVLCKDMYTKVAFRSSMDEIEKAINKMSARVRDESWINLSDLYYELGIKPSVIPAVSNDIGWHDSDLIEGNLPIMVVACLDDTGTIPVLGLDYEVDPFYKEGGRFRR